MEEKNGMYLLLSMVNVDPNNPIVFHKAYTLRVHQLSSTSYTLVKKVDKKSISKVIFSIIFLVK